MRRPLPLIIVGLLPLLLCACRGAFDPDSAPRIVFGRESGVGVDLVQVSTARPERVEVILPRTGDQWHPRAAVSPDGRLITFVTDRPLQGAAGEWDFTGVFGNGSQILLYDLRTRELRHLDHGGYGADRPAFTHDGAAIVFDRRDAEGDWDIYRLELATGALTPLVATGHFEEGSALSPDGRHLAYSSAESGSLQLYLHEMTTGDTRRLTYDGALNQDPAFSPDGRHLAYVSTRGDETNLYVMPLTGDGEARLVAALEGDQRFPSFSPDGDFIAFTTYYEGGGADIYLIDTLGWGPPLRVTQTLSWEIYPAWIPARRGR